MGVLVSKPWASRATGQPSEERTRTSRRETSREARGGARAGRKRLARDPQDDGSRTAPVPAARAANETSRQQVSTPERQGLIARIRQVRQGNALSGTRSSAAGPDDRALRGLEQRVAHLEQLVQGLQDAVHREARRQDERLAEIEAQIQPGAMGKALSEDARNRGL